MRYNASELKQMAAVSGGKFCSKEGVLSLREKEGKPWNKTDVMTERWCRLVDNLFFYFKTREMSSDPSGVFVLEGSHVRPVSNEGCAFILEFDGDNRSTYFLAREPSEARDWIKALEDASYTKLKEKYEQLMKRQNALHGEPTQENDKNYLSPDASQGQVRETKSANDSTLPVMELSLSCSDLMIQKIIDHKRVVRIRVFSGLPQISRSDAAFSPIFDTEYVRASSSVEFCSTLSFYQTQLVTPHTKLKFYLCQQKENRSVSSVGTATCSINDLFHLTKPLTISIESPDRAIGRLHLSVLRESMSNQFKKTSSEGQLSSVLMSTGNAGAKRLDTTVDSSFGDIGQNPNLKSLYCQAISRTYKFPTVKGEYVSVQEIMLETRLSFYIPELFLKLLIDQETRCIATLNSLKSLSDRLKLSRTKHIENKKMLLEQYNEAVKGIVDRSRNFSFKASIQKVDKELEFAPTNLHLQRMRVQHADCMSTLTVDANFSTCSNMRVNGIHDILTVGAATAHCLKYKQGGLLSLLAADKSKKDLLSALFQRDENSREITELPVTLPALQKEISSHRNTLETLLLAGKDCNNVPNRTSMESGLNMLNEKICELLVLLDNNELCKALHILLNKSNGPPSASSLVGAANSLFSPCGIEWDEMKTSVKSKLSDIIKKSHLMLDAADDLASLNQDPTPPPTFDEILSDLKELDGRLSNATNLAMQGHAIHAMQSPQESSEIIYRRNVVFSQVLSTCICGVLTNLLSSLREKTHMEDIVQHGMLIQFESLLSTYKHELGMLEDFIVGVHDLRKVTFCCECAPEQVGNNMDHLLPTLHGTRHKIVVKLRLDPTVFRTLPDALKTGSPFKVVPVIFNVGINEEQTLADKIGDASLQEYLNMGSLEQLDTYCQKVKKYHNSTDELDRTIEKLREAVHLKKTKNVEILQLSSKVCRLTNGIRVTSCKSAKDRTAMSVTLEQMQILEDIHELSPNTSSNALKIMRTEGTRRENTRKNVGVRKYAFTGVQLMTFPKQYRPPEGTYGKSES